MDKWREIGKRRTSRKKWNELIEKNSRIKDELRKDYDNSDFVDLENLIVKEKQNILKLNRFSHSTMLDGCN